MGKLTTLNANLLILRRRALLTQEEFAKRIGITRDSIASYEEGRASPKIETIIMAAEAFNVTLDNLIKRPMDEWVKPDVGITRNKLITELQKEFYFRYHVCPEGESPEDYKKRLLKGEGFFHALGVVTQFP